MLARLNWVDLRGFGTVCFTDLLIEWEKRKERCNVRFTLLADT